MPNLSWTTYQHMTDRVRDGSEGQYIVWEDAGVEANADYGYALDAFDYFNNRSPLGATASITAGDTIAPVTAYTNTGFALNKDTHVTFFWTNPTDLDFSHTEIYDTKPPYTTRGNIYGVPGTRSYWSAGNIGYGSSIAIYIRAYDNHGNKQGPALEKHITARTKKGPLRRIEGNFMFNQTGLTNGRDVYRASNAASWAAITFSDPVDPTVPTYGDLYVTLYPRFGGSTHSAYPTPILAPIKMGSVRGFTRDTAYYVYLTDSAGLKRSNALMVAFAQHLSSADSVTAYPLGRWWTGNTTVTGYFTPDIEAGHTLSGQTLTYGKLQDRTGKNYLDLQRGVFHSEGERGDYAELSQTALKYYNVGSKITYISPRAVLQVPASLVNMGKDNTFQTWGLGTTLPRIPSIHLQPARALTYSTNANFGSTKDQYLEMGVAYVTVHTCKPYTRLIAQTTTLETHSANSTRKPYDTSLGQYNLSMYGGRKSRPFVGVGTNLPQEYWSFYDALDTSQQGCNSVTRLDVQVIAIGSSDTVGRIIPYVRQKFVVDYDSAQGQQNPMYSIGQNYRDVISFDMSAWNGGVNYFNWTKTWSTAAAWKPKVSWYYSWLVPAYSPTDPGTLSTSGEPYTKRMWLSRVTYYNTTGSIIEQTGIGVADAIIII